MMKTCSKCREIKEFICFDKNKSRPDGHSCYCKECSSKRRKEIKNDDILLMKKAIRSSILIENKILKSRYGSDKTVFLFTDDGKNYKVV